MNVYEVASTQNRVAVEEAKDKIRRKLVTTFGQDKKVPIMDLRKRNDPDLAELADYVYQNVFLYYTMKQWGKTPDQIDPAVMGRVPIFVGDDDRYFPQAQHQGMPKDGYTALFERMLDHDLIDVFLGVDIRDISRFRSSRVPSCLTRPSGVRPNLRPTHPHHVLFNEPYRNLRSPARA